MKKHLLLSLSLIALTTLCVRAEDAKELYVKTCAKCHGEDGKGQTKMGQKVGVKDLTDAKLQADLKDDVAFKSIKEGVKDGDKIRMKANEDLSEAQIKSLVAYVRTFKK